MNSNKMIYVRPDFREKRLRNGKSLRDIAAAADLSPAALSRAENGKSIMPKTANKICRVLDMNFDELFIIQERG